MFYIITLSDVQQYLDNMPFVRLKDYTHAQYHDSSSVLKSDVSERNGSRFSVLVIRKPLQPVLDSRTRTALAVGVFVRYPAAAHMLLCSCSSSVLSLQQFTQCTV